MKDENSEFKRCEKLFLKGIIVSLRKEDYGFKEISYKLMNYEYLASKNKCQRFYCKWKDKRIIIDESHKNTGGKTKYWLKRNQKHCVNPY